MREIKKFDIKTGNKKVKKVKSVVVVYINCFL